MAVLVEINFIMGENAGMLIFDLDGTLIDSNGVWVEVDKTFLAAPWRALHQGIL